MGSKNYAFKQCLFSISALFCSAHVVLENKRQINASEQISNWKNIFEGRYTQLEAF